jgi:hypothetical protein
MIGVFVNFGVLLGFKVFVGVGVLLGFTVGVGVINSGNKTTFSGVEL